MKNLFVILTTFFVQIAYTQTATINSVKTRVLYQWIENDLEIVVANIPCENVVVKADRGTITGKDCFYKYKVENDSTHYDYIHVGIKKNGKIKWIKQDAFPVKKIPDPYVRIGLSRGDTMPINQFKAQMGLIVKNPATSDPLCGFSYGAELTHWDFKVLRNGKQVFSDTTNKEEQFGGATLAYIDYNLQPGDEVIFSNFTFLLFKKEIRKTEDVMRFVITK